MDRKRKGGPSSTDELVAKRLQMYFDDETFAQCLQGQADYSMAANLDKAVQMETTEQINEDEKVAQLLQAQAEYPSPPIVTADGFASAAARAAAPSNGSRQLLPINNVMGAMLAAARKKRNMIAESYYGIADGPNCGKVGNNAKMKALVHQVMDDSNFGFVQDHGSERDVNRASKELGSIFGHGNTIIHYPDGWGWAHQIRASLEPFIQG